MTMGDLLRHDVSVVNKYNELSLRHNALIDEVNKDAKPIISTTP